MVTKTVDIVRHTEKLYLKKFSDQQRVTGHGKTTITTKKTRFEY